MNTPILSRRGLLYGLLSTAAAAAIRPLPLHASLPRIVGDGIHDDAAGLQALIDGNPVEIVKNCVSRCKKVLDFENGHFSVSRGLHFRGDGWEIRNCNMTATDGFPDNEGMLNIHKLESNSVDH